MFESIKLAEYEWFLWLNSFHTPFWDTAMYWISHRYTWIPLYLILIIFTFREDKKEFAKRILMAILAVGLADYTASGILKPYFQRLRPCHDPIIQNLVHVVGNCGGQFGFASSHAANSFALATIFILFYYKKNKMMASLMPWAIIVSYSRIYNGVHYPTDILVGAIIGILSAFLFYSIYKRLKPIKND